MFLALAVDTLHTCTSEGHLSTSVRSYGPYLADLAEPARLSSPTRLVDGAQLETAQLIPFRDYHPPELLKIQAGGGETFHQCLTYTFSSVPSRSGA